MDATCYLECLFEKYPEETENAVAFFTDTIRFRKELERSPNLLDICRALMIKCNTCPFKRSFPKSHFEINLSNNAVSSLK